MAILVVATVSRLLYLLAYRSDPLASFLIHDARRYHDWAAALASGQSWAEGAFYQAPLYPYLVALVYGLAGARPLAVYAVQLGLGLSTILIVYRVARRAYGQSSGLAAAAVAALYGPLVFYETKLLPATAAVFLAPLLVERMQSADRWQKELGWLVSGIVLGAAALANPGLLLILPAGAWWIALDRSRTFRRRLLRIAWFAVGAGLLIVPVTVRNYRVSGEWVLISSNGGVTFYQGNNPNAIGVFSTPPGFSGLIFEQREESIRLAERDSKRELGDGGVSSFFFKKGLAFLAEQPLRSARLFGRKLLFALANEEQPLEYNIRVDNNPFRWLFPLPFAIMLALAVIRFFPGAREPEKSARAEHPILLLILVQGVILLTFYVSGRYRLPAVPALAAMAGCGAVSLFTRLSSVGQGAAATAATAMLVAAFSLAYVPLVHGQPRDQQAAMGLIDRARAAWEVGRREEALELLRDSIALDPAHAERHLDLGQVSFEVGRLEEAEHAVREALRRDPDLTEALFLLGVIHVERRRLDEAAVVFAEVLRREPSRANAANNLLGVLLHLGRAADAAEVWREMNRRGLPIDPSLDERVRRLDAGAE